MLSSFIFLFAALLTLVQADLTCLDWALISPVAGLFCHFEPAPFQTVKNASTKAVQEAIDSTKSLVEFDLTHNPVAVTYNFVENVEQGGLSQGEGYLQNTTTDFRNVVVGFGKETTNQVVQLYGLAHWNDISLCLIENAVKGSSRSKTKRAGKMAAEEGLAIVEKCVEAKIHGLSRAAVFNVTAPNEKIGSTISNLAGLLLPVGVEEEAATAASTEAVDLALPGSEDGARVYKLVDGKAEHFSDIEEAEATAEQMADPDWVKDNCKVSPAPSLGSVARTRRHLSKRGPFKLSFSCSLKKFQGFSKPKPVEIAEPDATAENGKTPQPELTAEPAQDPNPIDPRYQIQESQLWPANRELRQPNQPGAIDDIKSDIFHKSTSLVAWTGEPAGLYDSDTMLASLRKVFESEQAKDSALIQNLQGVLEIDGNLPPGLNLPEAEKIQQTIKAAEKDCLDIYARMQKLPARLLKNYKVSTRFCYTPPDPAAKAVFDASAMRQEPGMVQFIASDTTGIVIKRAGENKFSSLAAVPKSFNVLKGAVRVRPGADMNDPTEFFQKIKYQYFGQEASQKGAVHMKITIQDILY